MFSNNTEAHPLAIADDDIVMIVTISKLCESGIGEGSVPGFFHHLDGDAGLGGIGFGEVGEGVALLPFGPEDFDFGLVVMALAGEEKGEGGEESEEVG